MICLFKAHLQNDSKRSLFLLYLTILAWKNLCFTEFSTKMHWIQGWLLLRFFMCLHNQVSAFNSIVAQLLFINVIYEIDSKNDWLLLSIFKKALCLRYRLVFMWPSVIDSEVFNTLTLEQIFWKTKTFFKNWNTVFWLKLLRLKTHYFHSELLCQKPVLRQIEWRLQNRPIRKSGAFPVTTLFFRKICSSFATS